MPQALDGSTICAISTAPGVGGIAVVRVSGPEALRISSSIYNSGDSNMLVKVSGTVFCLIIAYFMLFNFGLSAWNLAGTAAAMSALTEPLTPAAQNFIAFAEANGSSEGFSIVPNVAQGLLILSLLLIQLGGIWMTKK